MESHTVPPFLSKTYDMVDDPSTNTVVSWSSSDNSFVVWNVPEFQRDLLPKYFKHNNFSSFVRQLNTYGFRKVDPDRFEFANEGFLRGQKHLLKSISRKKPHQVQNNQPPQFQGSKVPSCVEVGEFGLEEEVERLKRDKNVLMQELVRLRQQQQTTDSKLQTVGQRVQVMEQRQQQMMSFLAKAMQSPGFLNQLVQQKNDSNRRITASTKKRRLPGQEDENLTSRLGNNSPNGQIVKFHSSMNEAAKSMLNQILNMNSSSRLEPMNNSAHLMIDNFPSSVSDSSITSNRFSELISSEVSPASGSSVLPAESGFSSEVQSPFFAVPDYVKTDHTTEIKVDNTGHDTVPPQLPQGPGIMAQSSVGIPNMDFLSLETINGGNMNPVSPVLDVEMLVETNAFSPDQGRDIIADEIPKLPSINDVFWEQFLTASPLSGDTDEINSSSPDMTKDQELHYWDNIQNMNHLTEQMELLTSERRA